LNHYEKYVTHLCYNGYGDYLVSDLFVLCYQQNSRWSVKLRKPWSIYKRVLTSESYKNLGKEFSDEDVFVSNRYLTLVRSVSSKGISLYSQKSERYEVVEFESVVFTMVCSMSDPMELLNSVFRMAEQLVQEFRPKFMDNDHFLSKLNSSYAAATLGYVDFRKSYLTCISMPKKDVDLVPGSGNHTSL
jgi:hypothetical protein